MASVEDQIRMNSLSHDFLVNFLGYQAIFPVASGQLNQTRGWLWLTLCGFVRAMSANLQETRVFFFIILFFLLVSSEMNL